SVGELSDKIITKDWVKADAAATINATTRANARRTLELLLVTDQVAVAKIHERIDGNKKQISEALETLDKLVYAPEGKKILAGICVGATVAWWLTRTITGQLGGEPDYASSVAREIAAGNLAVDVQLREGDKSSLLAGMKAMRDSLAVIVGQVRQSSDSIATGSSQIATGNADLSQRTEEQASNLQQTAASMEQLTSTVKNNADTACQATQLASSASAVAAEGGVVVGQVVATMEAITASSKKIVDIIGV